MAKDGSSGHGGGYAVEAGTGFLVDDVEWGRGVRSMVFEAIDRASGADYGGDLKARDTGVREGVEFVVRDITGHSPEHRVRGVVNQFAYQRVMGGIEGAFVDRAIADHGASLEGRASEPSSAVSASLKAEEASALTYGAGMNDMRRIQEALSFYPRFVERDISERIDLHEVLGTGDLKALSYGLVPASEGEAREAYGNGVQAVRDLSAGLHLNADRVDSSTLCHVGAMVTTLGRMEAFNRDLVFCDVDASGVGELSKAGFVAMQRMVEVLEAMPLFESRMTAEGVSEERSRL